jgi:TldD protein
VVEQNGGARRAITALAAAISTTICSEPETWNRAIDIALAQALVNLESVAAPAGEMTVVCGPGWPGVLLHEAIGHGLEGDFNRKGSSAFSGRIGERVAAPGVTVVDDGSLGARRGSLSIDDEGTPTQCNTLIEDGILKGYIHDRLNARLMGVAPTGNGRRESFAHAPMPRMTNTFMLGGKEDPGEILSRVKNGIYAKSFGGGQVDITSGKFVFSCTEAYKIENGRLGAPIKGATLIGDGPTVLTKVAAIGNDMALDEGIGICGKGGQSVPAGVGQPTLLIEGITVGGTALIAGARRERWTTVLAGSAEPGNGSRPIRSWTMRVRASRLGRQQQGRPVASSLRARRCGGVLFDSVRATCSGAMPTSSRPITWRWRSRKARSSGAWRRRSAPPSAASSTCRSSIAKTWTTSRGPSCSSLRLAMNSSSALHASIWKLSSDSAAFRIATRSSDARLGRTRSPRATWCPGSGAGRACPLLHAYEAAVVRSALEADGIDAFLFDTEMNWGGLDGVIPCG